MLILGDVRVRRSKSLQEMEAPLGDVLAADVDDALTSNPTSMLGRMNELGAAQLPEGSFDNAPPGIFGDPSLEPMPSPKLDANAARQKVKDAGLEGLVEIPENGLPELAVDILIRRKKEERERQSVQGRAPGGLGVGLLRFGAALGASALDPINVGTAFLPVVGAQRYAAMLAGKTTLAGRAGVRAGVGALEGAAGAALVEPIILAGKALEQGEYGLLDSFLNVTLGSVLGAGLHAGGGAIGDLLRPGSIAKVMSEMPPEAREAVLAQAIGARVEGGPVRADAVLETLARTDERVARVLERDRAAQAEAGAPAGRPMDDDLRVAFWYEEIKRLRAAAEEPKGESLASFVRERGGLRGNDLEGAEVKAVTKDASLPPGFWNNKTGRNADDMALAAWEAGYIGTRGGERPTLREFYDALAREARGERVYPAETRARMDADDQQLASVARELDAAGLNLTDDAMKVARVLAEREKRALAEMPEARDYTRETEDPDYLEASRDAEEAAVLLGLEPDKRFQRATEELALAEERLADLERAGLLTEEDTARMRLADEAVAQAKNEAAAMQEGALCMARSNP
jgi:hypothetical protein